MEEPSVLDYLKAKLTPWRGPAPTIPDLDMDDGRLVNSGDAALRDSWQPSIPDLAKRTDSGAAVQNRAMMPWRGLAALLFALLAQRAFEPPDRGTTTALVFYGISALLLLWATIRGEWRLARPKPVGEGEITYVERSRLGFLLISIPIAALAYWSFQSYLFNPLNVFLWGLTFLGIIAVFISPWPDYRAWIERLRNAVWKPGWSFKLTPWMLVAITASAVVVFFRVFRLVEVPPEMISDHAEKLLDIADVLGGQYSIYFPRNTGREALQMYLTAGIALVFKTGISFLSLKIGTVLAGLFTLPFVFLLGKEVGNRNVGLYAMLFAGIAYWPNVTSRIALRFTLYPLFVAPTLFFLIRGLRTGRRNDFILTGIAVGLGLHGYSSFRIVPFVVLAGVGLFYLHHHMGAAQRRAFWGLVIIGLVSFVVFLPLFRYAVDNPDMFSYRTLTRVGSIERPLPGPVWQIFLQNLWNASIMFFWSNGGTWVHSVALRPALDVVSASLYAIGVIALLWRYIRQRHWVDLFLLVSIPILLLPSILSLAFPDENPSLNRTTGAWVPVFVIIGLSLDSILASLRRRLRQAGRLDNSW